MDLSRALKEYLQSRGAALVGIGSLDAVPQSPFPVGVAVAVPVPRAVVRDLKTAPTRTYYALYSQLNDRLNEIVTAGETFLRREGFSAWAQTTDRVRINEQWVSPLPHKTVATRAGLGWIGKNGLLVTKTYGSALRLSSLLTDAPLTCQAPVDRSGCGKCRLCVQACPGQALAGTLWQVDTPRQALVDTARCYRTQRAVMRRETGIDTDLCGKCFAVCAYTQRYLKENDGEQAHKETG